tara:strand:- start:251 stop:454 length:204 start_codon:yes stop_codon:yes gene_type:complete
LVQGLPSSQSVALLQPEFDPPSQIGGLSAWGLQVCPLPQVKMVCQLVHDQLALSWLQTLTLEPSHPA